MNRRDEYVRGGVHPNTVEGYYSVLKRGMKGVYQNFGERRLRRYLIEFDLRYSHRAKLGYDDTQRALLAMNGAMARGLPIVNLVRRNRLERALVKIRMILPLIKLTKTLALALCLLSPW